MGSMSSSVQEGSVKIHFYKFTRHKFGKWLTFCIPPIHNKTIPYYQCFCYGCMVSEHQCDALSSQNELTINLGRFRVLNPKE